MEKADEDWRDVANIIYGVVLEQKLQSRAFDITLCNTLKIGGQYNVSIILSESNKFRFKMII